MRSCATRQGVHRLDLKMQVRVEPTVEETPKALISGSKAVLRLRDQRVEDNAFHQSGNQVYRS
jgi:hypothetical protein